MPRAPGLERKAAVLTNKRLTGEAPVAGIVGIRKTVKAKKPTLKKTNSKGEVLKVKAKQPLIQVIKKFLKENYERKGCTRQAINKYVIANYTGEYNAARTRNALAKGVASGVLVSKSNGHRFSLNSKEKKEKKKKVKKPKAKKPKAKKAKTDKKEKKTPKEKSSKSKKSTDKKAKTPKVPKVPKVPKTKAPKEKPAKVATKPGTTRGVPKPKSVATSTASTPSASTGDLVWVWQYYDSGFRNYDSNASDVVEGVYQEYLTSPYTCDVRAVQSGQWQYEIDFRLMTQRNIQHENHTTRRIRRIQVPAAEKGMKHKVYPGDEKYVHQAEKK